MVDFSGIPHYKKRTLRNFDVEPLIIKIEEHTLIVKNNEVYHSPRLCEWMKNR